MASVFHIAVLEPVACAALRSARRLRKYIDMLSAMGGDSAQNRTVE